MFGHGARDDMMERRKQIQYMGTHGAQTDMSFTKTGDFLLWQLCCTQHQDVEKR